MFSRCPFVHLPMFVLPICFVRQFIHLLLQTCENDIFKMKEFIWMQICTSSSQGKGMKRSTWGQVIEGEGHVRPR